jgi:HTH-type transcriptional regulator, transcriptional repressor of NAD biosynthesis genes
MSRGLVLGKFAPFHKGHQLLVERSLAECDETVVLIYDSPDATRVPLTVRAGWIRRLYPQVTVIEGVNAPNDAGNDPRIMKIQEDYIGSIVPRPVTHFFSSEWYGEHVSASLGAIDVRVDESRTKIPVSGSAIRLDPHSMRQYVHETVFKDLILWDYPGDKGKSPSSGKRA